jgi:hypothetical protein
VITAKINVVSKDIVAGPPQMTSQKLEITLFVGDALEQKLFANTTVAVTGTGVNETKSYLDAIKKINPGHADIKKLLEESKQKIVAYYRQHCEAILEKAKTLSSQDEYDQAIYNLALIPDACPDCYSKSLKLQGEIFAKKIETEGQKSFQQAQTLWAQSSNKESAGKVMQLIAQIHPNVSFINKVQSFVKEVTAATQKQELREWEQQVKEYNDNVRLREARIKAFREIAVEYVKNQPVTVFRYILW